MVLISMMKKKERLRTISLHENDIIEIDFPDIDPNNDTLYVYKSLLD